MACVHQFRPRSMLVVHGTDDDTVPDFDARVISDAHGSAEMRIIAGAGHHLRDDPRAVAVLLGWLDRERTGLGLAASSS
jgi:putative redox protein